MKTHLGDVSNLTGGQKQQLEAEITGQNIY